MTVTVNKSKQLTHHHRLLFESSQCDGFHTTPIDFY